MISTASLVASVLATAVVAVVAQVQFLGVAIAGGEFGCDIDGTCPTGSSLLPLGGGGSSSSSSSSSGGGGGDGSDQMKHWASLSKPLNMFRLPISWQFLVNNQLGGDLHPAHAAKYDQLVQICLGTGAYCIIDIHNFARWNGGIIGQGGPTDDHFVSLWTQLAAKYAAQGRIVFELMNEPHDLDMAVWASTCQKVVTAIRLAGATNQMILLPGTNFSSAATLVSSGSAAALMNIKNPDGSTNNLLLDVHKYLDEDNSGTHKTCTTDNVQALTDLASFLRQAGRKGLVSETGASDDPTCLRDFCSQNQFINMNSDVYVGLVGWAAGSFDTKYILSLTPSSASDGQLVDKQLMQECLLDPWTQPGRGLSSMPPVTTTKPAVATATAPGTLASMTVLPPGSLPLSGTYTVDVSTMSLDGSSLLTESELPLPLRNVTSTMMTVTPSAAAATGLTVLNAGVVAAPSWLAGTGAAAALAVLVPDMLVVMSRL